MNNIEMASSYLRQAEERLKHAKEDVVRQSPEVAEFALKASLRIIGVEPPKFHDVGHVLRKNSDFFPEWFKKEIDVTASISRILRREREPSIYGEVFYE